MPARSVRTNSKPLQRSRRPNQLQLAEYICWVSSAVGTIVASTSMQFAYAGVPLSLSLLLNLANRRRIEVSTHRRTMGAVAQVQQQLSQDLAAIERRLREVAERHDTTRPTQSQLRLQQLHALSQETTKSQLRVRDLDDFRLIYQEIVSLQEQHRHVYESLAATIDYLNDSPLPQRMDELEASLQQLHQDFTAIHDRLTRSMPIDITRHDDRNEFEDITLDGDVLHGDVLDEIFEAERERNDLERRTITLPLEPLPAPESRDIYDAAPSGGPVGFASFDDGSTLIHADDSDGAAVFDADILGEETDITDINAHVAAAESGMDSKPVTASSDRVPSSRAVSNRPIELFSPRAAASTEPDSASNAIPPIALDDSEPAALDRSEVDTESVSESGSGASPVSFALSNTTAATSVTSATEATLHPVELPAFDDRANALTEAESDTPRVPPQDWQRLSTLTDHGDWVSDLTLDGSSNVLISASFDRTIQFWNVMTGESLNILSEHSSPVCAIALNRNMGWLVSGSWDRTVKIWDFESRALLETLVDDSDVAGSVRSLAVSPNGRFVASGWFDRTIAVWDVRVTTQGRQVNVSSRGSQIAHSGRVDALAFSPTGSLLASASADGTVKLWSVDDNTGELTEQQTFADSAEPINAVVFSRDGTLLADANRDRAIRIWDVETGEQRHRLTGHAGSVTALAMHPDGETLVSASADGTIRLWNLPTGQSVGILTGSRDAVMSVAVSEDGQLLVSGSADGSIDVWRRWGKAELPRP